MSEKVYETSGTIAMTTDVPSFAWKPQTVVRYSGVKVAVMFSAILANMYTIPNR
jgi:hypothetical protein